MPISVVPLCEGCGCTEALYIVVGELGRALKLCAVCTSKVQMLAGAFQVKCHVAPVRPATPVVLPS